MPTSGLRCCKDRRAGSVDHGTLQLGLWDAARALNAERQVNGWKFLSRLTAMKAGGKGAWKVECGVTSRLHRRPGSASPKTAAHGERHLRLCDLETPNGARGTTLCTYCIAERWTLSGDLEEAAGVVVEPWRPVPVPRDVTPPSPPGCDDVDRVSRRGRPRCVRDGSCHFSDSPTPRQFVDPTAGQDEGWDGIMGSRGINTGGRPHRPTRRRSAATIGKTMVMAGGGRQRWRVWRLERRWRVPRGGGANATGKIGGEGQKHRALSENIPGTGRQNERRSSHRV